MSHSFSLDNTEQNWGAIKHNQPASNYFLTWKQHNTIHRTSHSDLDLISISPYHIPPKATAMQSRSQITREIAPRSQKRNCTPCILSSTLHNELESENILFALLFTIWKKIWIKVMFTLHSRSRRITKNIHLWSLIYEYNIFIAWKLWWMKNQIQILSLFRINSHNFKPWTLSTCFFFAFQVFEINLKKKYATSSKRSPHKDAWWVITTKCTAQF